MSVVRRIVITNVNKKFDAKYVADKLQNLGIALVDQVRIKKNCQSDYVNAKVTIREWCDTESAYNLIKRLQGKDEAWIVYEDDYAWNIVKV